MTTTSVMWMGRMRTAVVLEMGREMEQEWLRVKIIDEDELGENGKGKVFAIFP